MYETDPYTPRQVHIEITTADLAKFSVGAPKLPTKNRHLRYTHQRGVVKPVRTERAWAFIDCLKNKLGPLNRANLDGFWELRLFVYSPTRSRKLGGDCGHLDPDACLFPVRDALQVCGVVDDDMRLLGGPMEVVFRRNAPGLLISLREVSNRIAWRTQYFGDMIETDPSPTSIQHAELQAVGAL